jgi:uncharacterized protein YkwD
VKKILKLKLLISQAPMWRLLRVSLLNILAVTVFALLTLSLSSCLAQPGEKARGGDGGQSYSSGETDGVEERGGDMPVIPENPGLPEKAAPVPAPYTEPEAPEAPEPRPVEGETLGARSRAGEADTAKPKPGPIQPEPEPSAEDLGEYVTAPRLAFDSEEAEAELLRLINVMREEAGAEPLGLQEELRLAARIRAAEAMAEFSHTRPDDTPYNTAFDEAGFDYAGKYHGENLASLSFSAGMFNEKDAALEMFEGLGASPGHRENMIRQNFSQAGVGIAVSLEGDVITVASAQLFASL